MRPVTATGWRSVLSGTGNNTRSFQCCGHTAGGNMIIKNAKFMTSYASFKRGDGFGVGEIAVAGKSNVGKSSFINYLANYNGLAKTSATPGKTKLINYFSMNNGEFMLVDLPGYGFAKVGEDEKKKWDKMIGAYLTQSENLKGVVVLVDVRHEPTVLDRHMIAYLHHYGVPFFVVATKSDKLSKAQIQKQKSVIANALSLGTGDILTVSALKKEGKEAVLEKIENLLTFIADDDEIDE